MYFHPADSSVQTASLGKWPLLYQPLEGVQHTGHALGERERSLTQFLIKCGLTGTVPCSSEGQFGLKGVIFKIKKPSPPSYHLLFSHILSVAQFDSLVLGEINSPRPNQLPLCNSQHPLSARGIELYSAFPMVWSLLPKDESPMKATHCPQQTKRSNQESVPFMLLQELTSFCNF